jgi:hypothetical protein
MGAPEAQFPAGLPVVCTVIGPGFGNFRVFGKIFYSPKNAFQLGYLQSVAIRSDLPGALPIVQAGSVRQTAPAITR